VTGSFANQSGRLSQLFFIPRIVCHDFRDAMSGEKDRCFRANFFGQLSEGLFKAIFLCGNEARMIKALADFFNKGG
jgi:hypothetical protein